MSCSNKKSVKGKLWLVGAGPGDPKLITLKGFQVLKAASVVLFDNLANKALLNYLPETCLQIYVGKKPYEKYNSQEEIHQLIVDNVMKYGEVVRLKGGDPFIFGRGFEEMIFARQNGIEAEYVPGVSSMQGAGLNGIPLTHRGICDGFWAITGTKKDGSLSIDLKLAMQSNATVVVYMGMKKLKEISNAYRGEGKGAMPAAIIQHATLSNQKMVVGLVKDLEMMAALNKMTYPAIIVIGETVALSNCS